MYCNIRTVIIKLAIGFMHFRKAEYICESVTLKSTETLVFNTNEEKMVEIIKKRKGQGNKFFEFSNICREFFFNVFMVF